MSYNWNLNLPLHGTDKEFISFSVKDEGIITNSQGLPYKTPEEFERYFYMKNDQTMVSLFACLDDLTTALSVAARLDD